MSDEIELEFKRFSKDKQEQVRQLVAFATLMGLTGKDLVSIGGKLDRIALAQERKQRLTIVKGYDIKPIGSADIDHKFKLTLNGIVYHFVYDHYDRWQIKNTKTNKRITVSTNWIDWGRIAWKKRGLYNILWALHNGVVLP